MNRKRWGRVLSSGTTRTAVLPVEMTDLLGAVALKFTAHDLPPVVALRGLDIHELDAYPPFATMVGDGTHLQLSGWMIVANAEMDFNLRSHRVLYFVQDAYAYVGLMSARNPAASLPEGPNKTRQSAARRVTFFRSEGR